jgi:uncharacterized ferritin-like protein (DUF455 family)
MEVRQFAEQVVFATTLEEKLQAPGPLTDERPGSQMTTPASPGRPVELRFKNQRSSHPDLRRVLRLEREEERGALLHFFANHELLATELMALVLLRFPDAPPAFRRGVLRTLAEEQEHTKLYLQRMRECGVAFGDFPVSGYFWRAIASMQSPMDYVSGLSLTFEQANLDFARHFERVFASSGDNVTARLLQRIHHDEIGHVAYGLKWFRRWKNPAQSDWEAFCSQLRFPLSPGRAKGLTLNVEARAAAGFDPAFIAELNVYSQSRGRTPDVFWFNPLAEENIACGRRFTPTQRQRTLASDLANLPQFLCRQDDIVLIVKRPSTPFLAGIKQAGFALPEFIELDRGQISPVGGLTRRKLGALKPWAWAPESVELLEPLFSNVTRENRSAQQRFNAAIAQLYSKAWSAAFLRDVLRCHNESWLCSEDEIGVTVRTEEEALRTIADIRARGHHRIVVKQTLGLAGQNAIRLWEPALLDSQRRWIVNSFNQGRQLIIEPWLERVCDFSIQLEMDRDGLKLRGYTGLIAGHKGEFQANWAAPNFRQRIPVKVIEGLRETEGVGGRVHPFYNEVFRKLEKELETVGFAGPVGIDAFTFRAGKGVCRLKPVVEINPRYTMGRLTIELMERTNPGIYGLFRLITRPEILRLGFGSFAAYARSLQERFPLRLTGAPVPKISEGVVCLTDPEKAVGCLGLFHVSRSQQAICEAGCGLPGWRG